MKIILTFFVLLFSSSVFGEWFKITQDSKGYEHFIDLKKININGHERSYYWLENYPETDEWGSSSALTYELIDCRILRIQRFKYIFYSGFMGKGKITSEYDLEPTWVYPTPDSVMEARISFVCNL